MSLFRKLIYSFLITLLFSLSFVFLLSSPGLSLHFLFPTATPHLRILSQKIPPQSKTVDVVARVGGYAISTLSGWTSPFAEVSLSFQGATRKTLADKTGFFIFTSVPFPDSPEELCLISQDINQLPSYPLCIAPPSQNENIEIKDILLSPSLSLEDSKISTGKTTKASGMTFPRSPVQVYLFTEKDISFWARISASSSFLSLITYHLSPKSAYAANFPVYKTKSNENGYFEFSLPSNYPSNNRLFVGAQKSCPSDLSATASASAEASCEGGSPKSNTLAFQIMGFWNFLQLFWNGFLRWLASLRINCDLLWLIVLLETLILLILLFAVLAEKDQKDNKKKEEKTKEEEENKED